ncbi:hypothetical protein [Brevifollis gellanilyticus]|uniref:Uncharacterized protein n=1 Tax=Brevifollis gellanilyticus TaxID=748831 RepID=A0A512MFS6_9BACT|nr:hypothetical protein [Brevifollis gellanilyticus]GEP45201.1 hypothetical protein BGE01nite_44920 [Brevifollis gellanilyticus]
MKLVQLIALVQIFHLTQKGLMCAAIYGGVSLLFAWVRTENVLAALIWGAVSFTAASIYFWALDKLDSGVLWWLLLVIGGFVVALL